VGRNLPVEKGVRVLDCRGKVALPGLVNSHHHFFQVLTRCLPRHRTAGSSIARVSLRNLRYVDGEAMQAAARLAIAELLLTGCTTTSDHQYLFPKGSSKTS